MTTDACMGCTNAGRLDESDHPVCFGCTSFDKMAFLKIVLDSSVTESGVKDGDVLQAFSEAKTISEDVNTAFRKTRTSFGVRLSDKVASVAGTWTFIIWFFVLMFIWMGGNVLLAAHAFDPYPYVFLNLVLSCLAGIQAPIIMMAQNRQGSKDRMKFDQDYKVALKGEVSLMYLDWKVDTIMAELKLKRVDAHSNRSDVK